ncbi:hypothetical protein Cgig2_006013 [Carnegiea gigantea]|uniref:Uncharacterized protein n=1 Tax=Carnegiea gigantea TaxID=171969 RepID=A0A9Q1L0E7_9CARY|nr:hypothetical protein Cgig2_006013 [Carnegiea gigantea]
MGREKQRQIIGLLESITALARLCAKYTRKASRKLARVGLLRSASNKRFLAIHKERDFRKDSFGDGGLWRRAILMGDKCQPPDFSGVIYYDCDGNRVSEPPMKSPRGSPFIGKNRLSTTPYLDAQYVLWVLIQVTPGSSYWIHIEKSLMGSPG